ncbi:MAG TPA: PAS domain-containing protein [Stellaceae bacterium]|nr:PAS domain-containing protein [Stellaceae bacterium]
MPDAPPPAFDWQRVERWTAEVAAGDTGDVCAAFSERGARGPALSWQPMVEALGAHQLRFLLRYWEDLRGTRRLPAYREIDAVEMRPALGYVHLLDAVEGGRDFRYRVFGSIVAAVSDFDMTGQLASTLKASAYVGEFGLASLRAVFARREPLFTVHGPPTAIYTATWHRLILPLADDQGDVARVLVGMVPMAHDGRPVALRL